MTNTDINDFSSYFSTILSDNNGKTSVDINEGIRKLFGNVNTSDISEVQRYLVSEFEEGYPDLVAGNSAMGNTAFWWWLLILNGLDDPLDGIKENWVYSINSTDQINQINDAINTSEATTEDDRIGEVVELN